MFRIQYSDLQYTADSNPKGSILNENCFLETGPIFVTEYRDVDFFNSSVIHPEL